MILEASELSLTNSLSVPPERVQQVFEALLVEYDVLLSVLSDESPRVLTLTSLQTGARTNVRDSAWLISPDAADVMRAHPAILVETVVDMP